MNDMASDSPQVFFREAAAGKPEAFSALADLAIEAGTTGRVSMAESLVAAEIYALFAAAVGGEVERQRLSCLLLSASSKMRDAGDDAAALAYEEQACLLLRDCADKGDDLAAEALNTLRPGMIWEERVSNADTFWQGTLKIIADMAAGDPDAFSRGIDLSLMCDGVNKLRGLVMAEQIARLAAANDDPVMQGKLAAVLWLRAAYEDAEGDPSWALVVKAECASVLLALAEGGDGTVAPHLQMVADSLNPADLAQVAAVLPSLLLFRTAEGAA